MTQVELESKVKTVKDSQRTVRGSILQTYNKERGEVEKLFDKLAEDKNLFYSQWHKKRSVLLDKLHEFKRAGLADFSEEVSTVNKSLSELKQNKTEFNFLYERQYKNILDQRRQCADKMDNALKANASKCKSLIRELIDSYFDSKAAAIPAENDN